MTMFLRQARRVTLNRRPAASLPQVWLDLSRPTPQYGRLVHNATPGDISPPRPRRRLAISVVSTIAVGLGVSLATASPLNADSDERDETIRNDGSNTARKITSSTRDLLRAYFVYSMCSVPWLVDNAPALLDLCMATPGLREIAAAVVRRTFFDQFVGGDSAEETLPVLERLRASNKGALFAYSVEVDEAEAFGREKSKSLGDASSDDSPHKRIVNEMIHCIDVAGDFEDARGTEAGARRTWVAVKITALLQNANALIKLSEHLVHSRPALASPIAFPGCPTLSDLDILWNDESARVGNPLERYSKERLAKEDIASLCELHADLVRICTRAEERGIRIIIDAEYSWYQPAIDALVLSLMRRFNALDKKRSDAQTVQPLVYGTFQTYLRRTPDHLAHSLLDATLHNYALGAKLVRGAYHTHEVLAHDNVSKGQPSLSISPEANPPVWTDKQDTDDCYNQCVWMLINAVNDDVVKTGGSSTKSQTLGVLFGTHNWSSTQWIIELLVKAGLGVEQRDTGVVKLDNVVTDRVTLGQLYGMAEELTDSLVAQTESSTPFVIKYVPYGALVETMPYLSRRAIENKSVLGNGAAQEERRRAGIELRRRVAQWVKELM